jgi:hypothetical protein
MAEPMEDLRSLEEQEEAQLSEANDEFLKKWSGWAILGPFIPAVFAVFTIVTGMLVVNTWEGTCGAQLDLILQAMVVVSYLFLFVYTWVFLGDTITMQVPILDKEVVLFRPFRSLKFLIFYYLIIGFISWIVMIVGTYLYSLQTTVLCAETAPLLYYYTGLVVGVYWTGWVIVMLILINMKFGGDILEKWRMFMKEPTVEELEEKIFRKKFSEFDKEKNGFITVADLPAIITELGAYVPEEELPDLMASLDPLQKGKIAFDDLLLWFQRMNAKADGAGEKAAVISENEVAVSAEPTSYKKKKKN